MAERILTEADAERVAKLQAEAVQLEAERTARELIGMVPSEVELTRQLFEAGYKAAFIRGAQLGSSHAFAAMKMIYGK